MREALHIIEPQSLGPLTSCCALCAYVVAHILKGTTMRSLLGLVVAVVVIVIVLRLMGVL
jgi:hypothetical protein